MIDNPLSLPTTTKGDIIVHDGADDARLPVGSDTQVLTADSAKPEGMKWAPPGGAGAAALPVGYIDGLKIAPNATNPLFQVDLASGDCRDKDDTFDISLSASVTIDIMVSGANGLDTGSEAADTFYAVHVIADSSATNPTKGLLSLSATAPTLPSGYDKSRRIGWVRNNATSNLLKYLQRWNGRTRRMWYDEVEDDNRLLSSGNSTTYATVDLSSLVPSTSENVILHAQFEADSLNTHKLDIRPKGSTVDQSLRRLAPGVNSNKKMGVQMQTPCNSSQEIEYKVTSSANSAHLSVAGYDDEL